MNRLSLVLFFILTCFSFHAQNLVPNGGFEQVKKLNFTNTPYLLLHWKERDGGKSECVLSEKVTTGGGYDSLRIAYSWMRTYGYQHPRHGSYLSYFEFTNYSESDFPIAQLNQALKKDSMYYAEFWVSLADRSDSTYESIGLGLSKNFNIPKKHDRHSLPIERFQRPTPSLVIQNTNGPLTDTIGWTKISGLFNARGDELQLTIGDFSNTSNAKANSLARGVEIGTMSALKFSMYFVDDIMLKPYGWSCAPASTDAKNRNSVILAANKSFYFEPDKFELSALSEPALLEIVDYLNAYSGSFVEICITPFPNEAKNVLYGRYASIRKALLSRGVAESSISLSDVCDNRFRMKTETINGVVYQTGMVEVIFR